MLSLEYNVKEAGWATAKISSGFQTVEVTVSYLHDTLAQLASSTLELVNGSNAAKVVFMDEPGEYQLKMKRIGEGEIEYRLHAYGDWESWGMAPSDAFYERFYGVCSIKRLKQQVTNVLREIHENLGEKRYKELWIEHDFPTELYRQLDATEL